MGENSVVLVKFNTGQTKSLMVKYANLSRADVQSAVKPQVYALAFGKRLNKTMKRRLQ